MISGARLPDWGAELQNLIIAREAAKTHRKHIMIDSGWR
jgi:hypothetical protein